MSVEHILPIALGGKNRWLNKALAHKMCNALRGVRLDVEPHPSPVFEFVRRQLLGARALRRPVTNVGGECRAS